MVGVTECKTLLFCSYCKSKFKFFRAVAVLLTVAVITSCTLAVDDATAATSTAPDTGTGPSPDTLAKLSPSREDRDEVASTLITKTSIHEDTLEDPDVDDHSECGQDNEYDEDDLWLFQYEPVEVGYEQDVEVEPGMFLKMKTLAVEPPVFEIRNFLSHDECDHVMSLAIKSGLASSQVIPEIETIDPDDEAHTAAKTYFSELDKDENNVLDAHEILEAVTWFPAAKGIDLTSDHIMILIEEKLDKDCDGLVDLNEFLLADTSDVEHEIEEWLQTYDRIDESDAKRSQARVSDQAWLDQWTTDDEVLLRLQDRVIGLTLLPSEIIQTSEHLQVVRYKPGGHYHAHYDSAEFDDNLECAHTFGIEDEDDSQEYYDDKDFSKKRLCRLATVLYYLNDVEEGGETAFPVADNETFTQETLDALNYDIYDLTKYCYKSNIVVPPEKGKAIMWYNHYLDLEQGWLGDNRNYSLHGGCDVISGTKWIANNWINVDNHVHRQILFHKKHFSSDNAELSLSEDVRTESEAPPEEDIINNTKDEGYASDSEKESLTTLSDDLSSQTEGEKENTFDQSLQFDSDDHDDIGFHVADEL